MRNLKKRLSWLEVMAGIEGGEHKCSYQIVVVFVDPETRTEIGESERPPRVLFAGEEANLLGRSFRMTRRARCEGITFGYIGDATRRKPRKPAR